MKWNEWRIKERNLSCSKWEVQTWPNTVQWDPISKFLLHTQIKCTHNRIHHTGWRGVWFSVVQRGRSPSWINPCLRVLVPSPVGLDSTHYLIFSAPLHFEWTQQQVPRLSAAPFSGLKMNFWLISNRNYIFLHCLIMSLFSSMLSLYFAFHFFYW